MALSAHKAYNSSWCCTSSKNPLRPLMRTAFKVSATLKIAIFSYLRFQRFQIDMLESFLLKKKIRRKYYFCRKFFLLTILIDR